MSATTTPTVPVTATPSPKPAAKAARNRRSRSEEAEIVRAKKTFTALSTVPSILKGIALKDAHAAKVRIDKVWVGEYSALISQAETASDGRAVAKVDLKKATAQERTQATQLATLLTDVRDQISTHFPDDAQTQEAYGRGVKVSPKATGATIALAGSFLSAWDGEWKQPAESAGVTQATMDQIQSLRNSLSAADMGQQGVITGNVDGTLTRSALFVALRQQSAFAVRVVGAVFGKTSSQALALSDPRPLTKRDAVRKAATKAKNKATKLLAKAKKAAKPKALAATVKRRAQRKAVAARVKTVTSPSKTAAKRVNAAKAKVTKAKARG
jgi:hypothetical protein